MYHGNRWMEDERFFTPMINSKVGQIFVADFIKVCTSGGLKTAKVIKFFKKVIANYCITIIIITQLLLPGKL